MKSMSIEHSFRKSYPFAIIDRHDCGVVWQSLKRVGVRCSLDFSTKKICTSEKWFVRGSDSQADVGGVF